MKPCEMFGKTTIEFSVPGICCCKQEALRDARHSFMPVAREMLLQVATTMLHRYGPLRQVLGAMPMCLRNKREK